MVPKPCTLKVLKILLIKIISWYLPFTLPIIWSYFCCYLHFKWNYCQNMISKKEYEVFHSRYLEPYTKIITLISSSYLSTCGRKTEIMVSFCLRSKLSFGKRFYNYQCTNYAGWNTYVHNVVKCFTKYLTQKCLEVLFKPYQMEFWPQPPFLISDLWYKNWSSNAT